MATMAGLRTSIEGYVRTGAAQLSDWSPVAARLRAEHRAIVASVRAHDPETARRRVHEHITGYYAETFHPDPPPPRRRADMVERHLPKPRDLAPLMQFKKPELSAKKRRLEKALTVADLRQIAKRRTPKAAFDYTEGAAEAEISLARARQAFEDIEFHPRSCATSRGSTRRGEVLGAPVALPFGIAPTGFTRMMQTEGEIAGAGAAGRRGSRSRCRPWAPPRSRTCRRPTRTVATGSSSTCGRTGSGRWRWSTGPPGRVRHPAGDRRRSGGRRPPA